MAAKTPAMRCMEFDRGKSLESLISEAIEAGHNWSEIAADLGISRLTLRDWVTKLGLKVTTQRLVQRPAQDRGAGS